MPLYSPSAMRRAQVAEAVLGDAVGHLRRPEQHLEGADPALAVGPLEQALAEHAPQHRRERGPHPAVLGSRGTPRRGGRAASGVDSADTTANTSAPPSAASSSARMRLGVGDHADGEHVGALAGGPAHGRRRPTSCRCRPRAG